MLLDKLQYLNLIGDAPSDSADPSPPLLDKVTQYATRAFTELHLQNRKPTREDVDLVHRHGDHLFFHMKAFPKNRPDTYVIVICREDELLGHILIDLLAEYSQPRLDCPAFNFAGIPTRVDIEHLIPKLDPDSDSPFAILETGDGTYMQTLHAEDGYVLEHQLVNTACHYEVPGRMTKEDVISAMVEYAFGRNEVWLNAFDWRHQAL